MVLAAAAGGLVLWVLWRGATRRLRALTAAVQAGEPASEAGATQLAVLGRALNRMRDEIADRVVALERTSRARDAILGALEEGIVLFDETGAVLYRNDRAVQLLGEVPDEHRLTPAALGRVVADTRAGASVRSDEAVLGVHPRTLVATGVPLPDHGSVLLVLRDVTEARTVDAVRRDFVTNASHELKTPVASIQALAETLVTAAGEDPASVDRFARQLEREALRLSRIVSDLLDLSRLEVEPGGRSEIRFDRLVAQEAGTFRAQAEDAGLSMDVEAQAPVRVTGSPRDLGLLVRNLVQNAVQYTRAGGRVTVSVRSEDGSAVLEVRDTGTGIPRRDQARVFERFYRVDRARSRETGGTGLGLSIVKHVAETHGGTVAVQSELGRGSAFTVRLPLSGRA